MFRTLKHYWRVAKSDVASGKGLEVWIAIPVALAAIVVGLAGITSTRLTITLLGVLIIATSLGQLEIKELLSRVSQMTDLSRDKVVISNLKPYELPEMIIQTSELYIGGIDLYRTFANNEKMILAFLEGKGKLRVLVYEPSEHCIGSAVARSKKNWAFDRQQRLIQDTIDEFQDLKRDNPKFDLHVRVSPYPFHMGFTCFEPGTAEEKLFLKHYAYKADTFDGPWFILDASDEDSRRQFDQEIEALWSDGIEPVQSSD